ncbi:MAG: M4 family metallopeptidase [Candidatus Sumerlaeota bacterium]|nr:M4 family metallopeptidase [Candidatus Sumerlaeota bacterium]
MIILRPLRIAGAVVGLLLLLSTVSAQPGNPESLMRAARARQWAVSANANTTNEKTRLDLTQDGYIRFIGAPSAGAFPVQQAAGKTMPPESLARSFIQQLGDLVCEPSPLGDFAVLSVKPGHKLGRSYMRLQQTYGGIRIWGAEAIAQTNENGVECLISRLAPKVSALDQAGFAFAPTLTSQQAVALSTAWAKKESHRADLRSNAPELIVYDPALFGNKGAVRLAWLVEASSRDGEAFAEQIVMDAHNGKILWHFSLIETAKQRAIYDSNNTTANPGTLVRAEGSAASGIVEADKAYDYLGDTYDFYYTMHGRDSIDDLGLLLSATVRYCDPSSPCPYQNAYWDGHRMYFGDHFAVEDVTGHELTHGVTQYCSGLVYANQSGAINESFSDIWGEFIELTHIGLTQPASERWLIGENMPIGAIRNMADPPQFGDPDRMGSPLWYSGSGDNGGVHANSGVGNKLCYLLTDGASFNGYTITSMGVTLVAQLFYECQTHLLTSSSDYEDLYRALTQAGINLELTAAERENIENACLAVEIKPLPAGVGAFHASSYNGIPTVALTWALPVDAGFQSVIIRRDGLDYPSSTSAGVPVFSGVGASCSDGPLVTGIRYYYSAWAIYSGGAVSKAAHANIVAGQALPDYFTELFDASDNDLANHTLTFIPGANPDGYYAYCKAATAFPTDPAGGTSLTLTDDSYATVTLTGGAKVLLYGTAYSEFFAGSNGSITFGSGDSGYEPSLAAHFAAPRIAALFDDLYPETSASVTWRQLEDRAAITYQNIPAYGCIGSNSFQIEMFFDGTIQITWLDISDPHGLAGISRGQGLPSDFVESDLTAYPELVPDPLLITPATDLAALGYTGGPFAPSSATYMLTNRSATTLNWAAATTTTWLTVSPSSSTLAPGESTSVSIAINSSADALTTGVYYGSVIFVNLTSATLQMRCASLTALPIPGVIEVTDSIPPINDWKMPFGPVFISTAATRRVTVANTDTLHDLVVTNIRLIELYNENFDDGSAQDWQPTPADAWQVVGGEYKAETPYANASMESFYAGQEWADAHISVMMRRTGTDEEAAASLILRAGSDFDYLTHTGSAYRVSISGSGSYYVGKYIDGEFSFLQNWTNTSNLNTSETANLVEVAICGGNITVAFNGVVTWSGRDDSILESGWIGLLAYSGDGCIHYFDNVIVSEPNTFSGQISAQQQLLNQSTAKGGSAERAPLLKAAPAKASAGAMKNLPPIPAPVSASAPVFKLNGLPAMPVRLGPGQSLSFDAQYAPLEAVSSENRIRISSNDRNSPEVIVKLNGAGALDWLAITPQTELISQGVMGGPFAPGFIEYTLTNNGSVRTAWTAQPSANWVYLFPTSGALDTSQSVVIRASVNANSYKLLGGQYYAAILITDMATSAVQTRGVRLTVLDWMNVTPADDFIARGIPGGPFTPISKTYTIGNLGGNTTRWTVSSDAPWITVAPGSGSLAPTSSTQITASLNAQANHLAIGVYPSTLTFRNTSTKYTTKRRMILYVCRDYFTELFPAGSNDLAYHSLTWQPDGGMSFYKAFLESVTEFPTDPAGGTKLPLTDDYYAQVTLTGGAQALLYGTAYGSFYVGSNGHISFLAGDIGFGNTFSEHFNQPRISALADDLNPSAGGSVSWKQTEDLVAITWQNVPIYGAGGSNSFQVEMFFDGRIRITWLELSEQRGLAGISQGRGVPGDFLASDLTAYVDALQVSPLAAFNAIGFAGGPFAPRNNFYTLTNRGAEPLNWSAATAPAAAWLSFAPASGALAPGTSAVVAISFNSNTNALSTGTYAAKMIFINPASAVEQLRSVRLTVRQDYFTQDFAAGGADLSHHQLTLIPDGGAAFYRACCEPVYAFPVNPAGATILPLGLDSCMQATLDGGAQVALYGVSYGSFYVGSNGYITFGTSDTAYDESYAAHFRKPRISGLFDDLYPGNGAAVSWRQLSDRAVVTWQNITKYGASEVNNFQIEMFFDGTIRITWLDIADPSFLAGVSRGNGVPADFLESDLTAYPAPSNSPYRLKVNSANPSNGVSILVSPNDNLNYGSAVTPLSLVYNASAMVSLTAPYAVDAHIFLRWDKDGSSYSAARSAAVAMTANMAMMAVYAPLPSTAEIALYDGAMLVPNGGEVIVAAAKVGGESQAKALSIFNAGGTPLTVMDLILPAGFTGTLPAEAIAPGVIATMTITLKPKTKVLFGGSASFKTNADTANTFKINLIAVASELAAYKIQAVRCTATVTSDSGGIGLKVTDSGSTSDLKIIMLRGRAAEKAVDNAAKGITILKNIAGITTVSVEGSLRNLNTAVPIARVDVTSNLASLTAARTAVGELFVAGILKHVAMTLINDDNVVETPQQTVIVSTGALTRGSVRIALAGVGARRIEIPNSAVVATLSGKKKKGGAMIASDAGLIKAGSALTLTAAGSDVAGPILASGEIKKIKASLMSSRGGHIAPSAGADAATSPALTLIVSGMIYPGASGSAAKKDIGIVQGIKGIKAAMVAGVESVATSEGVTIITPNSSGAVKRFVTSAGGLPACDGFYWSSKAPVFAPKSLRKKIKSGAAAPVR